MEELITDLSNEASLSYTHIAVNNRKQEASAVPAPSSNTHLDNSPSLAELWFAKQPTVNRHEKHAGKVRNLPEFRLKY